MTNYLLDQATAKKTPQLAPIPGRGKDMMANNAGGFAFKADSFARLERFLILGSEGGTFYVGQQKLTGENLDNVRACIATDGIRAVRIITEISQAGRAPKNDPALYALALAASYGGDPKTRAAALAALPKVARTGTHLFTFAAFIDTMRGWGPALRKAVADWYLSKPADKLAYQLVKYQQRNGWSHRDLLRLCHLPGRNDTLIRWAIKANAEERDITRWANPDTPARIRRRAERGTNRSGQLPEILQTKRGARLVVHDKYPASEGDQPAILAAFEQAQAADEATLIRLIRDFGLTREMIPTQHQKSPAAWEALLEKMPLTAMIRTLGRMGAAGLLAPFSEASKTVCARLDNAELLRKARVHPIQALTALLTYKQGRGQKGSLAWTPVSQVVDALDAAFYKAFDFVEPTQKRFYLGVDVSGSMTMGQVAGVAGLTPNMGAAAMAMLIARTEPEHFIGGFSTRFIDLGISRADRLDAAMQKCQRDFGGTDCAVAIHHALLNRYPVDAFVVITDGETWAGDEHASQALADYRRRTALEAKLIVINMVANRTQLNDPADAGSLDIVGFDSSVPSLINQFLGVGSKASGPEDSSEEEAA